MRQVKIWTTGPTGPVEKILSAEPWYSKWLSSLSHSIKALLNFTKFGKFWIHKKQVCTIKFKSQYGLVSLIIEPQRDGYLNIKSACVRVNQWQSLVYCTYSSMCDADVFCICPITIGGHFRVYFTSISISPFHFGPPNGVKKAFTSIHQIKSSVKLEIDL